MLLELHLIQNFAPSNLNRDDTGSPKSCEFGGFRRARISSQCIKRAIRQEFGHSPLIPEEGRAQRSKRFVEAIAEMLEKKGRSKEAALSVVEAGIGLLDLKVAKEGKTEYLLFLGGREVNAIAEFCDSQWEMLTASAMEKGAKKGNRNETATKLAKDLQRALDGGRAADLALFGRMLADLPQGNVAAASQVAHAISTHQVAAEFDYYTAVDDLKPEDTAGADMIGTVEFNSACYYRYANIDLGQLRRNLGGDGELAIATVGAFLEACRDAVPSGKQNSFAARNAPSFFFSVVRESGAWSLTNAFLQPVKGTASMSLTDASIARLDSHWQDMINLYGLPPSAALAVCAVGRPELANLGRHRVDTFADFAQKTVAAARAALGS